MILVIVRYSLKSVATVKSYLTDYYFWTNILALYIDEKAHCFKESTL